MVNRLSRSKKWIPSVHSQSFGLVLKVLGLSTAIALSIKYLLPSLIPSGGLVPRDEIALLAIGLPSLVIALILLFFQSRESA